jgi:hypothetical protein
MPVALRRKDAIKHEVIGDAWIYRFVEGDPSFECYMTLMKKIKIKKAGRHPLAQYMNSEESRAGGYIPRNDDGLGCGSSRSNSGGAVTLSIANPAR